jgi:hypothetical protein
MSKKRKALQQTEADEVKSEVVSYRSFFAQCVTLKMVQPWQEKEIHAFFKDLGLTDKESTDLYKDALAKY